MGQLRPVAWLNGAGQVYATFVYGLRVNVPEYMTTSAGTYRILTDHLGSPRLEVNTGTGAVEQRVDYDAWGQVLADTSPGFQPFGFAGGVYDRDTGLVRFGARDYDPQLGRWTNKDPLRFRGGDTNLYLYAANNPANYVDPRGQYTEVIMWGPDGSFKSMLGHVTITINGLAFSFSPGRNEVMPFAQYVVEGNDRPGRGVVLNLTYEQEAQLAAELAGIEGSSYSHISNNCGQPVQRALARMGIVLPDSTTPAELINNLQQLTEAIGQTAYPPGRR